VREYRERRSAVVAVVVVVAVDTVVVVVVVAVVSPRVLGVARESSGITGPVERRMPITYVLSRDVRRRR